VQASFALPLSPLLVLTFWRMRLFLSFNSICGPFWAITCFVSAIARSRFAEIVADGRLQSGGHFDLFCGHPATSQGHPWIAGSHGPGVRFAVGQFGSN